MAEQHKANTIEFQLNECSSSETSGETSRPKSSNIVESIKTLKINDRASPIPFKPKNSHHPQIYKSKSGQSIKDFAKRQET